MGIRVYKDSAATIPIRTILGRLDGDGVTATFTASATPAEVRKFSSTAPYGILLVEGTDYTVTANADGTATISLTVAPNTGEVVVAFDAGEPIFNDQYAIGNSPNVADRTMEQQLFVKAEGVNASNVTVNIADLVVGAGADPAWHYLAPDNAGTPGTYGAAGASLSLGNINNGAVVAFWIKCVVPENTPMENYRDVYLEIQSIQFSIN